MLRRHHVAYKRSLDRLSLARDGDRAEEMNFLCEIQGRLGREAEVLMDIVAELQNSGRRIGFWSPLQSRIVRTSRGWFANPLDRSCE